MGLTDYTNRPKDPNGNGTGGNGNPNNPGNPPGNPNDPFDPNNPNFPFNMMGIVVHHGGGNTPTPTANKDDQMIEIVINYNEKFKNEPKVLFRDEIIEQLLSILIGKNKPNALMVGMAGTGKTAIVETLAGMLENNDPLIPDQLKGYTVFELPISNIVAGKSLVGELEKSLNAIIAWMEDPDNKAILFLDEIHQLLNGSNIYATISQILKPALARGNLHVIGATTLQEANNLSKDPALARRFSRVLVDELTRPQTIEILHNIKPGFLMHYKTISIQDDLLEQVAILADQYRPTGSHRPDNAITLLDRSIGDAIIKRKIQMANLQKQVDNDPNDVAAAAALQAMQSMPVVNITATQVTKTAIALATGNSKKDVVDMTHAKDAFIRIKGQDTAVTETLKMMQRRETNLFPSKRPITMLFIGPSGVGKTEISKIIAQELTGQPPIILNMTEYSSDATINRIIGSPPGYVGSDSNAEMPFDKLESNPYSIILLDEFEKAHPAVQRLFYTVFDEGTLTDNHGKVIDFSKSIIIATTNAGYQEIKNNLGFGVKANTDDNASVKDLSRWFDPALLNRFMHRIQFNPISKEVYRQILQDTYKRESDRINKENRKLHLDPDLPNDKLDELTDKSYNQAFGARPAFQTVKEYIEDVVFSTP